MTVVLFAETVTTQQSNDDGSGSNSTLQVYRSSPDEVKVGDVTFPYYFGQVATNGDPATVLRVHFTDTVDFREVKGDTNQWEQFWTDAGSGDSSDYTIWKIKDSAIPPGFKCLSPFFFQRANGRPAPTDDQVKGMVFVSDRLCKLIDPTQFVMGWSSIGSGALAIVTLALAKDRLGYLAIANGNVVPPTGIYSTLDFSNNDVRLVQTWDQLDLSVMADTSVELYPHRRMDQQGDSHILSMTKDKLTSVYNGNQANFAKYYDSALDCEDFAVDMRAAVARACRDDPLCVDLKVGCFCGIAYLESSITDLSKNLYLQADGTCAMFEPMKGTFETVAECRQTSTFEGVYF